MRIVIADSAVHFAQNGNAGDALSGALKARHDIGDFFAQGGWAGGLAVGARHHRQGSVRMREFGQFGNDVVESREHDIVACGLEHHAVRGVVDVFRGACKMDELGSRDQLGQMTDFFFQPVFHCFDIMVGRGFNGLDARGVFFRKIRSQLIQ